MFDYKIDYCPAGWFERRESYEGKLTKRLAELESSGWSVISIEWTIGWRIVSKRPKREAICQMCGGPIFRRDLNSEEWFHCNTFDEERCKKAIPSRRS